MSNDEKLMELRENLTEELTAVKKEQKEILDKVLSGEKLTRKENKRVKEIAKLIKDLEGKLSYFQDMDLYESIIKDFKSLSVARRTKEEKDKISKRILSSFRKLNKSHKGLTSDTLLTEEERKDIPKTKAELTTKLSELEEDLRVANRRGYNTSDIEKEISEVENKLEEIKNIEESIIDIKKVEADLSILTNSKTTKEDKEKIITEYETLLNNKKDKDAEIIAELIENETLEDAEYEVVEEDKDKKPFKDKVKAKLQSVSEKLKRSKGKIAKVAVATALVIGIILVAKQCSKEINKSNTNDDLNNSPSISQTYEDANKEVIEALVNKGYDEYKAFLMSENFDKETIDAILSIPLNKDIENYADVSDFNLNYINDYETVIERFNLSSTNTVDYVNRAYEINKTNFFEGALIEEVAEILMAIDNRELQTTNNANLAQAFNTSFNRVIDNYLFGELTEADLLKIDALQYMAKDGSDLDLFLTEFSSLAKRNIADKNDVDAKNEMYKYVATFALSLNGFTNEDEDINIEKPYNTNAQVNDYYDWYIAYNSFIAPLYPAIVKDNEFEKYEELQYIMISALEGPEFEALCGQSFELRGE